MRTGAASGAMRTGTAVARVRESEPESIAPTDGDAVDAGRRAAAPRRDAGATRAPDPARRDAGVRPARVRRRARRPIAKRARSSERMVYYYYGSKEGLFRAVLEAAYDALGVAEQALVLDDKPPREALAHFCRFVWRWYAEHPEFIGVLTAENQLQARTLRRSSRLDVLVAPVVRMLASLLARGLRDGAFRPGLDPSDLYVSIAGLGYFRVSNRHTLSAVLGRDLAEPDELERHWRTCEDMVLRYVDARIQSAG